MTEIKKSNFFKGVGRRKASVAQTRLVSGRGSFIVNGEPAEMPVKVKSVLEIVDKFGTVDISIVVRGGGAAGQKDAIALGIARALVDLNPDFRSGLRKAGFLTRDARVKERKKPGLKKARRAPQWSKR